MPLIEIVSEPDIRSAAEAGRVPATLKQILEYIEVSDASMEEGSLRVDANVSARARGDDGARHQDRGQEHELLLGRRARARGRVRAAVCAARPRERVVQQTMLWDAHRHELRPARSKEESHDYRYFPEPDLPPLLLASEWMAAGPRRPARAAPGAPRALRDAGLPAYDVDVLTATPALADYYEAVARAHGDAKAAANWVMGEVLAYLNNTGTSIRELRATPANLAALLGMVRASEVSNSAAKTIFASMAKSGEDPIVIADREGLRQVSDDSQLVQWIDGVLAAHPDEAKRFAAGEKKLLGVLVGLVMKASGGKADPRKVNQLLSSATLRQ